jgi:hypothetical protein
MKSRSTVNSLALRRDRFAPRPAAWNVRRRSAFVSVAVGSILTVVLTLWVLS